MADKDNNTAPKKSLKPKEKESKTKKKATKTTKKAAKTTKETEPKKSASVKRIPENAKSGSNGVKPVPENVNSRTNQPLPGTNADEQQADGNNKEEKKKKSTAKRNEKGQFVKGTNKIENSGRKPGTPNKYGNVRDRLKAIILPYLNPDPDVDDDTKTLFKDLMKIDNPATRGDLVSKFLPYITPKYSSTTISADSERPMAEEERLLELDKEYKKSEKTRRQTEVSIKTLTIIDNDNGGKETKLSQSYIDDCMSSDEEDNDDDE